MTKIVKAPDISTALGTSVTSVQKKIKELKKNYPKVKVVISMGGRGAEYPFNPAAKDVWPDHAVESLKEIIQYYNKVKDPCSCHNIIDGIDINYEYIKSSEEEFSYCVGEVIKRLKGDIDVAINVVSIAPSHLVQSHYKTLYWAWMNDINWVDYQFYYQTLSSKDEFVKLFRNLLNDYGVDKLLVGASTDPDDAGKMPLEVLLEGCIDLVDCSLLRGIFVWNANDSAVANKPFSLEEILQKILTKN